MFRLHFIGKWLRMTLLRTFVTIGFLSICFAILFNSWDVNRLTEQHKCPACYGKSLCPSLQNNPDLLKINYFGLLGWIMNSVTTKNVYQGILNSTEVIVKRLGHESEMNDMDKLLCKKAPSICGKETILSDGMYDAILEDVKSLLSSRLWENEVTLLRFCPSFQNMAGLFKNVNTYNYEEENWPLSLNRLANIWTMLHINPEPLLLQIFPKKEGWPFPQYLGACGRIIVETYEGTPLLYSYNDPWEERAWLSLQLLEAVDRFTSHSPDFALYLLDYSVDNIAVDSNSRISFVDLEHSIIVDKDSPPPEIEGTWNILHQSSSFCDVYNNCYYSPDDICQHKISDFNHYMLCKEILAASYDSVSAMPQGLLHSTPSHILRKHPDFDKALKNCSSDAASNHMISAQILRDILRAEVRRP